MGVGRVGAGILLIGFLSRGADAQDLRSDVRDHVHDNLEPPKKKKHRSKKGKRRKKSAPSVHVDNSWVEEDEVEEEEPEPEGPDLPVRVWDDMVELDLSAGLGYRGWYPQQFDGVNVAMQNHFTWNVGARGKFFNLISLHKGYYESNALGGPVHGGLSVASEVGSHVPKAAWALGMLGFSFLKVWEPVIRYESRSFETTASLGMPVCVVPRDAPDTLTDCPREQENLLFTSGFESFVVGIRYHASKDSSPLVHSDSGSAPPIFFGAGYLSYSKPYQLTIGTDTLEEYLFNSHFEGGGLALGTELGGGVDNFFGEGDMQLGLGGISLTDSLSLNDVAPSGWLIGYFQAQVTAGYRWAIIKAFPTLMLVPSVSVNGVTFLFIPTESEEGKQTNVSAINWDLFWLAQAALVLPL